MPGGQRPAAGIDRRALDLFEHAVTQKLLSFANHSSALKPRETEFSLFGTSLFVLNIWSS
jgi:hypothetical protein